MSGGGDARMPRETFLEVLDRLARSAEQAQRDTEIQILVVVERIHVTFAAPKRFNGFGWTVLAQQSHAKIGPRRRVRVADSQRESRIFFRR